MTETEVSRVADAQLLPDHGWQAVVWDDPVNLMSYVAYVFQTHFGFERGHAEELMLRVHHSGSAVVAEGSREAMEMHVEAMHGYGLWATVREAGAA
ncbi:ATP-dependent Clp protease adapter ClpS [Leucobacter luti]|nr:ATP-dependent Clp protease adapter ClpS [Leucobacter luti]MBL3698228.1 ATP-dependent Clp protease adapter ClpS [Leucobacter luti]